MVPRSETKTDRVQQCLYLKTSEKTVEVVDTVPVWTEVAEQYTVKVPTSDRCTGRVQGPRSLNLETKNSLTPFKFRNR